MPINRREVTDLREDFSRFVVHLTRDDSGSFPGGQSARKNFISILDDKAIKAFAAHCLHKYKINHLPEDKKKRFEVACFTEVPLNQIRLLTQHIEGRQHQFSDYGFVFTRQYLIEKGAQPAIYINQYGSNTHLLESVNYIFKRAVGTKTLMLDWRILPYVNKMAESYDFTWEREWRIRGELHFAYEDLVCAILPAKKDVEIQTRLMKLGVPTISPSWTYERIVEELAAQQRQTRTHYRKVVVLKKK